MEYNVEYSQPTKSSSFRVILPQVLAAMACNLVLMDLSLTMAFSTVVIGQLHQSNATLSLNDEEASWLGSIAYICQPLGSLASGVLVEFLGRKRFMVLLNVPFLAGWILFCVAPSYSVLFLANVIIGITIGLTEAPTNTYIAEICQPHVRGIMTASASIFYGFGWFLEYLLGMNSEWRVAAGVSAAIPVLTAICISLVPESPIWLISRGRTKDAEDALCWARGWVKPETVAQEMKELMRYHEATKTSFLGAAPRSSITCKPTTTQLSSYSSDKRPSIMLTSDCKPRRLRALSESVVTCSQEKHRVKRNSYSGHYDTNILTAFSNQGYQHDRGEDIEHVAPDNDVHQSGVIAADHAYDLLDRMRELLHPCSLRPLMLVVPFFFFVNWTGYTNIRAFTVHVFKEYHMPVNAQWSTVLTAAAGIFGALFLVMTIHRIGKRPLSLMCMVANAVVAFVLGAYAYCRSELQNVTWLPLVLVIILSFLSSTIGQIPWMLTSEAFPFRTRGLAGGICAAAAYTFVFIASKTYLDIERCLGLHGAFWFFGTIAILSCIFLYYRMVETEGKTLEDIELHFTLNLSARKSRKGDLLSKVQLDV